jgi:hypothetical protein
MPKEANDRLLLKAAFCGWDPLESGPAGKIARRT